MANKDQLQGKWNELKGKVKTTWGKLTDDDITQINGRRQELLGKLQSRYGYAKEKAEEELTRFEQANVSSPRERETAAAGTNRPSNPNPHNPNPRNNPNERNERR
jgi:uncharacterized protein YjbJ (UPF0337 family)